LGAGIIGNSVGIDFGIFAVGGIIFVFIGMMYSLVAVCEEMNCVIIKVSNYE